MNASTILERGRTLLEDHELTQFTFAKDKDGTSVSYSSPEACSFCTMGAFWRAAELELGHEEDSWSKAREYLHYLEAAMVEKVKGTNTVVFGIPTWNDTPGRTKADVLDLFDKAIALAKKDEE